MGKGIRFIGIILIGLYLGMYFKHAQEAKSPVIEWHKEDFGGITFESPFKLEPEEFTGKISPDVQLVIDKIEQSKSVNSGDVKLIVARTTYAASVKASLEGAAQGSINALAQEIGDKTPVPRFEAILNKPYEGIIGIYNATIDSKKMSIRSAYLMQGRTMYFVAIIFQEKDFAESDAFRILDSINLKAL